jgi:hypothetical protein
LFVCCSKRYRTLRQPRRRRTAAGGGGGATEEEANAGEIETDAIAKEGGASDLDTDTKMRW